MTKTAHIQKADGTFEPFDVSKLVRSLTRSGASRKVADEIANEVGASLTDGEKTGAIYRHAFRLLRKRERTAACRYSLRRAILELGPTGYPFEDLVAELFRSEGYTARTGIMVDGACAAHEVDVVAEKNGKRIGVEVKFHNASGLRSDLKVALYVKARADDIRAHTSAAGSRFDEFWLVTNTKFSSQAESYAVCTGLNLLSWSYPTHNHLQARIERAHLVPVTCLTTLSKSQKRLLMENKIVLCRSLHKQQHTLASLGIPPATVKRALGESEHLCAL